jgi:glycosyltransferase involved in cell wall biosynthesis
MKNVTVITTIKNEKEDLQAFIKSIFEQTLCPNEVVVVDGGSTDGTIEILKKLGEKYKSSLKYFVKPGLNISEGRNFAIEKAQNSIVASVDGGATLQKTWLEYLVTPLFEDKNIDVVSGFFIPEAHNTFEKYLAGVTVPVVEELQDEKFLPSSRSIAFRKSCWKSVGGYPQWLPICEDLVFDIKMKNKGFNFVVAPKALSSWRPRKNLKLFFIQYFKYARGDGHAKLWYRRHLIRYVTYITGILIVILSFSNILWLATAIMGGIIYSLTYYNRFFRHFPKESFLVNLGSYFMIPFLMMVGDVAKMTGFPFGIVDRWRGKVQFFEYRK